MDDLINRQAAKDVIANMEAVGYSPYATIGRLDALFALNRLPSAERHGTWIRTYNPIGQQITVCSVCGKIMRQAYSNYCSNCGAKMVNEDEEIHRCR